MNGYRSFSSRIRIFMIVLSIIFGAVAAACDIFDSATDTPRPPERDTQNTSPDQPAKSKSSVKDLAEKLYLGGSAVRPRLKIRKCEEPPSGSALPAITSAGSFRSEGFSVNPSHVCLHGFPTDEEKTVELYSPSGQFIQRRTLNKMLRTFHLWFPVGAPSGTWTVVVYTEGLRAEGQVLVERPAIPEMDTMPDETITPFEDRDCGTYDPDEQVLIRGSDFEANSSLPVGIYFKTADGDEMKGYQSILRHSVLAETDSHGDFSTSIADISLEPGLYYVITRDGGLACFKVRAVPSPGTQKSIARALVSAGSSWDLDEDRTLYESSLPPGRSANHIVGMGIAGSNDVVFAWYADGTVSAGASWDLDAVRTVYNYSLPPGKSPNDIVGMGIAGSNDVVFAWYADGKVSAGTSWDLDDERTLYDYSLPAGRSPSDIVGMGIAGSNDVVFAWYADGTVSAGTSWDLDEVREPYDYAMPSGISPNDIVGMGIAGSNDAVFAFYREQ